jgi:2-methylcitrate dehydratase
MTEVQILAQYVRRARLEDLSSNALERLKIRVLDTIGVAIGALAAAPIAAVRKLTAALQGRPVSGGMTTPDRAAFFNGALSRYLDFMDSYLAEGETCHPSDNLGAVLAAAEMRGATGADFLTALAISYQVQTRLSDVAPVRDKGFDHTTQGVYAAAAGVAKALGLSAGADRQCHCHWRERQRGAACDAHGRIVALERARLSEHGDGGESRCTSRRPRYFWTRSGFRGE